MKTLMKKKSNLVYIILLLVMALTYQWVWKGQFLQYRDLTSKEDNIRKEIGEGERAALGLEELEAEIPQLKMRLLHLQEQFFPGGHQDGTIMEAVKLLGEYGDLISIQRGEVVEREEYIILPLRLVLRGSFDDILRGIGEIENSRRHIILNEIIINSKEKGDGGSDNLQAQLQLYLYRLGDNGDMENPSIESDYETKSDPFEPVMDLEPSDSESPDIQPPEYPKPVAAAERSPTAWDNNREEDYKKNKEAHQPGGYQFHNGIVKKGEENLLKNQTVLRNVGPFFPVGPRDIRISREPFENAVAVTLKPGGKAEFILELWGKYTHMKGFIGIDDITRNSGSGIILTITGEDDLIYKSPLLKPAAPPIPLDLPIDGVRRLTFHVECMEAGIGDQAEVKFITADMKFY